MSLAFGGQTCRPFQLTTDLFTRPLVAKVFALTLSVRRPTGIGGVGVLSDMKLKVFPLEDNCITHC